jgi:putative transposase
MPRTARASQAGYTYHVLNRGNARSEVFHKAGDFSAFLEVIGESSVRLPMAMLAYCLMPNHFHMVVRPQGDGDLSLWMQWLMTTHVSRYVKHHGHSGHVWQGRFKAFPIQDDNHLVTVVRYVERNPLRANLVTRAEDWPWSSLGAFPAGIDVALDLASEDLLRCGDWTEFVNTPMTEAETAAIEQSIRRNRPFGSDAWTRATAEQLGLESSLRSPGGQRRQNKTRQTA